MPLFFNTSVEWLRTPFTAEEVFDEPHTREEMRRKAARDLADADHVTVWNGTTFFEDVTDDGDRVEIRVEARILRRAVGENTLQ